MTTRRPRSGRPRRSPPPWPAPRRSDQPYVTGSAIVVEHDAARLDYDGRLYRLTLRRLLRNTGTDPLPDLHLGRPLPGRPGTLQRPLSGPSAGLGRTLSHGNLPGRGDALAGQARPGRLQRGLVAVRQRPGPLPALPRRVGVDRVRLHRQRHPGGPLVPARRQAAHRASGGRAGLPGRARSGGVGHRDLDDRRGVPAPLRPQPVLPARYRLEWRSLARPEQDAMSGEFR